MNLDNATKEWARIRAKRDRLCEEFTDLTNANGQPKNNQDGQKVARLKREIEACAGEISNVECRPAAHELPSDLGGTKAMPESAELSRLKREVTTLSYMDAARGGVGVSGAAAELNKEMNLPENQMPIEYLLARDLGRNFTNTAVSIDTAGLTPQGWLDMAFAGTVVDHLGVSVRITQPGSARYPVVESVGVPKQRGKEEDAAVSVFTFGLKDTDPTRMALHIEFTGEDAYRLPEMEMALSRNMRMQALDTMQQVIISGDSGATPNAGDIVGFTTAAGIGEATLTQTNKLKAVNTVGAFAAMLDGVYATGYEDLRVVLSEGAAQLWSSTSGETTGATTLMLSELLRRQGINWRVRKFESSTGVDTFGGVVSKANGLAGSAVATLWQGVELIRDPYSAAKAGVIKLTANLYWNFGIVRADNWSRIKFIT